MTVVLHNPKHVVLGFVALLFGILIYAAFRPAWQAVWITEIISLHWRKFQLFTEIGNSLPSFLHVFGFSVLTAGIIDQKRWTSMIVCGFWLLLNLLFEVMQSDAAYSWLNDLSLRTVEFNPFLHGLKNYSLHAVYDLKDIVALISGAIFAYIVLMKTNKGG
jgi:hypothetical protein